MSLFSIIYNYKFNSDKALLRKLDSIHTKLLKLMDNDQTLENLLEQLQTKTVAQEQAVNKLQSDLTDVLFTKDKIIADKEAATVELRALVATLQEQVNSGLSPAGVQTLRETLHNIIQIQDAITADVISTFPADVPVDTIPTP